LWATVGIAILISARRRALPVSFDFGPLIEIQNCDLFSIFNFSDETIYALLGDLSPKYTESFGEKLLHALERLN
jgi:Protein of unknown function (DUF727)